MTNYFKITNDTMVVTSSYITHDGMPILEVSHEDDEEGGSLWQFHCGNGDYSMDKMQLVRLETILKIDPDLQKTSTLQMGQTIKRVDSQSPWILEEK